IDETRKEQAGDSSELVGGPEQNDVGKTLIINNQIRGACSATTPDLNVFVPSEISGTPASVGTPEPTGEVMDATVVVKLEDSPTDQTLTPAEIPAGEPFGQTPEVQADESDEKVAAKLESQEGVDIQLPLEKSDTEVPKGGAIQPPLEKGGKSFRRQVFEVCMAGATSATAVGLTIGSGGAMLAAACAGAAVAAAVKSASAGANIKMLVEICNDILGNGSFILERKGRVMGKASSVEVCGDDKQMNEYTISVFDEYDSAPVLMYLKKTGMFNIEKVVKKGRLLSRPSVCYIGHIRQSPSGELQSIDKVVEKLRRRFWHGDTGDMYVEVSTDEAFAICSCEMDSKMADFVKQSKFIFWNQGMLLRCPESYIASFA
ncbi:MAG: hypothetical protein LBD72_02510, partial [Puniceicoccales bacterium]|nr:hypothetical protein [Puniceicoccales bacterium]